jgi:hypothetical protein
MSKNIYQSKHRFFCLYHLSLNSVQNLLHQMDDVVADDAVDDSEYDDADDGVDVRSDGHVESEAFKSERM